MAEFRTQSTGNRGHFFKELAESQSNSQKILHIADTFVADICYSRHFGHCKFSGQNLPVNSGHPMIEK